MKQLLTFILTLSLAGALSAQIVTDVAQVRQLAQELQATTLVAARAALLANKKGLVNLLLYSTLFGDGSVFLAQGNYAKALVAYELARIVAETLKDRRGAAAAWLNQGTAYYFQSDYTNALKCYEQARVLFQTWPDKSELARAYMGLGFVYKEKGDNSLALAALQRSADNFNLAGLTPNRRDELANVLNTMSGIFQSQGNEAAARRFLERSMEVRREVENLISIGEAYYAQDDFAKALHFFQLGLSELENRPDQPAQRTSLLGNIANTYYSLGQYERALDHYSRNLELLKKLGDPSGQAIALEGIGHVLLLQGDLAKALESYRESIRLAEASASDISTAGAWGGMGQVYSEQGSYAEALTNYQKSLELYLARGDKAGESRMLFAVGETLATQGDYQTALPTYQKCQAVRVALGDQAGLGQVLLEIGAVLASLREFPSALANMQQALSIFERLGDKDEIAQTERRIGHVLAQQGDYETALKWAERAVAQAIAVNNHDVLWRAQYDAGRYQRALSQPVAARAWLESSVENLDKKLRRPPQRGREGARISDARRLPHQELAALAVEQNRVRDAFYHAEAAKSQTLRGIFRGASLSINKVLTVKEKEQELRLTTESVSLTRQIARVRQRTQINESALNSLRNKLAQNQTQYERLQTALKARHPSLALLRGEIAPPKPSRNAPLAWPHTKDVFIEYLVTESKTYLFVLNGPGEPAVFILPIDRKALSDKVAQFRQALLLRDNSYRPLARELYDLLLQPAEKLLAGRAGFIIAPDTILWELPFGALLPTETRHLGEDPALSFTPSLEALRALGKHFAAPQKTKLAYAGFLPTDGENMPPDFAGKLQALYNPAQSKIYQGKAATKTQLQTLPASPRVLHFGAATALNEASPLFSYSTLAGKTDSEAQLQAREIMQINNGAGLVVLPVIVNAPNQLGTGKGLLCIYWSWVAAGSRAVLLNALPATQNDTAAPLLSFLRDYNSSVMPAPSVVWQKTIRAMLQGGDYSHPYYWSGFVVVGAPAK